MNTQKVIIEHNGIAKAELLEGRTPYFLVNQDNQQYTVQAKENKLYLYKYSVQEYEEKEKNMEALVDIWQKIEISINDFCDILAGKKVESFFEQKL